MPKKLIKRQSVFEYYVSTKKDGDNWRLIENCTTAKQASDYVKLNGRPEAGKKSTEEMCAFEVETIQVVRSILSNKGIQ